MPRLSVVPLLACLWAMPAFADSGVADRAQVPLERSPINPRYLLMGPSGRAVTEEDFRGRFQLIAFGYTSCPDVCPTTLLEMKQLLDALGDQAGRLQPIFVTVDPERDTVEVLRNYTEFFHPRILGLTGTPELVRRAADHFKIRYEKVREPGAPPERYTVDHSVGLYLIGPDGRFHRKFAYETPIKELIEWIRGAMADYGTPATRSAAD